MTPAEVIDYINMDDCHGESYEIFDCMSESAKLNHSDTKAGSQDV